MTHGHPQIACMLQCAHLAYGCVLFQCLYASVYPCYLCVLGVVSLCIYMRTIMCIYVRVMCTDTQRSNSYKYHTNIWGGNAMNSFLFKSIGPSVSARSMCVPCVLSLSHCSRSFPSTPHQETLHYTKEAAASVCTLLKGWVKAV